LEEVQDLIYTQMEEHILSSDYVEDDMNDLLEEALQLFLCSFYPERSRQQENLQEKLEEGTSSKQQGEDVLVLNKIQALREIPQPVQRTPAWYQFRWNLITASNAWKAFESQSTINQLIYEKCQPLKDFSKPSEEDEMKKMVNTNTTLHWGQKYEPLSVMLYEYLYKSKVEDFGCIQHPKYSFLGASPDGIVIESETGRFGRMLEIKNIVNREITGIPKKEYWVQMQLQMEVCDLDECDFLETKFVEYAGGAQEFADDQQSEFKGIILYFHTKDGSPFYVYKPLDIVTPEDIEQWEQQQMEKYEGLHVFIKFLYWKLEKMSCVLVARNREWFENNVSQLASVWKTIERERVTGYEHRAPQRRVKKEQASTSSTSLPETTCFLKVVKIP
jgi:putative phage-type endonuclease